MALRETSKPSSVAAASVAAAGRQKTTHPIAEGARDVVVGSVLLPSRRSAAEAWLAELTSPYAQLAQPYERAEKMSALLSTVRGDLNRGDVSSFELIRRTMLQHPDVIHPQIVCSLLVSDVVPVAPDCAFAAVRSMVHPDNASSIVTAGVSAICAIQRNACAAGNEIAKGEVNQQVDNTQVEQRATDLLAETAELFHQHLDAQLAGYPEARAAVVDMQYLAQIARETSDAGLARSVCAVVAGYSNPDFGPGQGNVDLRRIAKVVAPTVGLKSDDRDERRRSYLALSARFETAPAGSPHGIAIDAALNMAANSPHPDLKELVAARSARISAERLSVDPPTTKW